MTRRPGSPVPSSRSPRAGSPRRSRPGSLPVRGIALAVAALAVLSGCGDEATPRDPCEGVTCSGFGRCMSDGSSVWCECDDDYEPHGLVCRPEGTDGDADGDGDGDGDNDGDIDVDADVDTDEDSDIDFDIDFDNEEEGPTITGVNGTGPVDGVEPRSEDRAAWDSHAGDRVPASQRVDSAEPVLLVTGTGLAGTTAAHAEGQDGTEGNLRLTILEAVAESVRLRFPSDAEAEAGLYLLTLETPGGDATALVYLLRGNDGPRGDPGRAGTAGASFLECDGTTCSLDRGLVVEGQGSFEAFETEVADIGSVETGTLTVPESARLPVCPSGYVDEAAGAITRCRRDLGDGRFDEMVRVGDLWVDRFEASVWRTQDCGGTLFDTQEEWTSVLVTFPYHGSYSEPLYACSVSDVSPSRWLTWFQAQSACAASGKRLLTNAEWQAAVAGTGEMADCMSVPSLRTTGATLTCMSYWGVEDMVGNLVEWVEDWYGQGANSDDGSQPETYFGDIFTNVDPAEYQGDGSRFPAAGLRGGNWYIGGGSGPFMMDFHNAPSRSDLDIGFRCAMRSTE